jgi:3'-phosphoadenosine 5'-phosphosulfate sulfotransferase (PAPS reductase)/FAD synthetase
MKPLRILSLGAGVQSSTLALMIEHGEIEPIDFAVFCDTKHETDDTYEYLEWLKKKCSFEIKTICAGDLLEDTFTKSMNIPFHIKDPENSKKGGIIRRQCTSNYKIVPVYKEMRKALGLKKGQLNKTGRTVEQLMGISLDEVVRMKINPIKWITNVYPLVDKRITRQGCKDWMAKHKYPTPPRSACWFCPFNSKDRWIDLKENKPEYFQKAVDLDRKIRNFKGPYNSMSPTAELFVHSRKKPLEEIDFEKKNSNQLEFSEMDECEGVCFI